jgi:hypothetical protein
MDSKPSMALSHRKSHCALRNRAAPPPLPVDPYTAPTRRAPPRASSPTPHPFFSTHELNTTPRDLVTPPFLLLLLLPSPPRKRVWQLASSQVLCTSMSILSVPGLRANICPSSVVSSIFFCHAPTHTPKRHTRTHTALVSLGFRV